MQYVHTSSDQISSSVMRDDMKDLYLFTHHISIHIYTHTLTYIQKKKQVDREYLIIKTLSENNFPVPKPIIYCSDTSVIGTEFYLMQYVKVAYVWYIFF